MKNKIIIDYMNFYSVLYVILCRFDMIYILHRHKYMDTFYSNLLRLFGKEIIFTNMKYQSNDFKDYLQIKEEKEKIIGENFSKKDLLSSYLFKKFYFDKLHPIVELKILFQDLETNCILINYPNILKYISKKNAFYDKFQFYNTLSFVDDLKRVYFFRRIYFDKNKLFFKETIRLFEVLINIRFSFEKREKHQILTFSKSINNATTIPSRTKNMNELEWLENTELKYIQLDPTSKKVFSQNTSYHLYTLHPMEIFSYFKEIHKLYSETVTLEKIHPLMVPYIFDQIKNIYFINKIIKTQNIKIVFTSVDGTYLTNIMNIIGFLNENVISCSATWSLNYFPQFSSAMYKNCDVFFAWGNYQRDLYLEAGSVYKTILNTGYIGDYALDKMKTDTEQRVVNFKKEKCKIFSVYDNVAGDDAFITYQHYNNFYKGVIALLKSGKYACVIKSKLNTIDTYLNEDLFQELHKHNDKIIFQSEHADLGPAMSSDFIYALSMSSLGNIGSVQGKKTFLYDENNLVVSNEKYLSHNTYIIHNIKDFLDLVSDTFDYIYEKDITSGIDSFVDGKAQERIFEYIYLLLDSKEENKLIRIENANSIYGLKYGQDKLHSTFQKKDC